MKKIIIIASIIITIFVSGCNNTRTKYEKELTVLTNTAKKDVELLKEFSKEDIDEAVEYIRMNIHRFTDDRSSAKKIIYYSTYLNELGNRTELAKIHPITDFSLQVNYIVRLWYLGEIKVIKIPELEEMKFVDSYLNSFTNNTTNEFIALLR